jgi:uncharacterized membrane protein YccC
MTVGFRRGTDRSRQAALRLTGDPSRRFVLMPAMSGHKCITSLSAARSYDSWTANFPSNGAIGATLAIVLLVCVPPFEGREYHQCPRGASMNWHRGDLGRYRGAAVLAFRLTAAALLALWLAHRFQVRLPLWVVMTAIVVTQTSVGRSLKATLDYFAGTLCGAVWAGLIAALVPHTSEVSLLSVLVLALAPLAFVAAINHRFGAGPITAAIVILVPEITHATPIASAIERVTEVSLGGLTGLVVSFALLPSSAFEHARVKAAHSLERMAKAVPQLIDGFGTGLDSTETHRIQDGIGTHINELSVLADEAERERRLRLAGEPLTGPILRTLLRLRHDLVIMGRAAGAPLPASLKGKLHAPLASVGEAIGGHLQACATALVAHQNAPPNAALDSALAGYMAQIDAIRHEGLLRPLPSEDVERFFAIGFALEQLRHNLQDLDRCVDDWAGRRG